MRALWGEVFPQTRAVVCSIDGAKRFTVEFYIDGPVSDSIVESASCVETEVIADFPADFEVRHRIIRLDCPGTIPTAGKLLIFLRKE
jgi:hypothetical protein